MADINGNTALWDATSSKHNSILWILYHCASLSDPYTAADLLCTAAKRNDLTVMKELLKHGLNIDSNINIQREARTFFDSFMPIDSYFSSSFSFLLYFFFNNYFMIFWELVIWL